MKVILTNDEANTLQGYHDSPGRLSDVPARLVELGYLRSDFSGRPIVTEIGKQAFFKRRCFNELLAFSKNSLLIIQFDCEEWLNIDGLIKRKAGKNVRHSFEFEITQKGWDWIAYYDADES